MIDEIDQHPDADECEEDCGAQREVRHEEDGDHPTIVGKVNFSMCCVEMDHISQGPARRRARRVVATR